MVVACGLSKRESCLRPCLGGISHSTRSLGWKGSRGELQFLPFDITSSRSFVIALNLVMPPPNMCIQIVYGMRQFGVGGFRKTRRFLGVWEFRAESKFPNRLPVPTASIQRHLLPLPCPETTPSPPLNLRLDSSLALHDHGRIRWWIVNPSDPVGGYAPRRDTAGAHTHGGPWCTRPGRCEIQHGEPPK